MRFLFWDIKLRRNKKQKNIKLPYHYGRVVWTEPAIYNGLFDEYNKEIQIIKEGKIIEKVPYTEAEANAIKEAHKIPVIDFTKINSGEIKIEEMDSMMGYFSEVRN